MSQLDQYVNTSADDFTTGNPANSTDNELVIRFLSLSTITSLGFAFIDTSSIPDDATINSAIFYWYDHEYLEPKGAGVDSSIWIYNGASYQQIYNFTAFTVGAKSHALTTGELAHINKTGDTKFRFTTQENVGKDRTWRVRAYDGYSGANEQPRLVVNYTEAGAGISKSMILR